MLFGGVRISKDIKLSNIKGLLIVIVVLVHFLEIFYTLRGEHEVLFLFLYAPLMPLFVFISGYFSKRVKFSKILNFLLLYLLFQAMFSYAITIATGNLNILIDFSVPFFHLWYLVSMIFWYLLAIGLNKLKLNKAVKLVVLIMIFIISLGSRFVTADVTNLLTNIYPNFFSYTLSFQRTMYFAIFFFVGFFLEKELMVKLYSSLKRKIITVPIIMIVVVIYLLNTSVFNNDKLFRGSYGIEVLEPSQTPILLLILMAFVISTLLGYIVLNVVNDKKSILTRWGDNTLPIYLFHPFFYLAVLKAEQYIPQNSVLVLVIAVILALIVSLILSTKWFVNITRDLCNPYGALIRIFGKKNKVNMNQESNY